MWLVSLMSSLKVKLWLDNLQSLPTWASAVQELKKANNCSLICISVFANISCYIRGSGKLTAPDWSPCSDDWLEWKINNNGWVQILVFRSARLLFSHQDARHWITPTQRGEKLSYFEPAGPTLPPLSRPDNEPIAPPSPFFSLNVLWQSWWR